MSPLAIQQLLDAYYVPWHIRRHCQKVAKVAYWLGKELIKKGERIDLQAIYQASLLHDFMRICDIRYYDPWQFPDKSTVQDLGKWDYLREKYKNANHAEIGAQILRQRHEPKLANLVLKHDFWLILDPVNKPQTWEEKIVYYADKRVDFEKIVSLDERFREGHKRNHSEKIDINEEKKLALAYQAVYQLEKEIFDKIELSPDSINQL